MNKFNYKAQELMQEMVVADFEQDFEIILNMLKCLKQLFILNPDIQLRWRVWVLVYPNGTYFHLPCIDVKSDVTNNEWHMKESHWPIMAKVDFSKRKDGVSTDVNPNKIVELFHFSQEEQPLIHELGVYATLYHWSNYYRNTNLPNVYWKQEFAKDITKEFWGTEKEYEILLSSILTIDNYFDAVTEVISYTDEVIKMRKMLLESNLHIEKKSIKELKKL